MQVTEGQLNNKFWKLYCGDSVEALKALPDESVDCIVTSPPYFWLRDYGVDGQIGLEATISEYVQSLNEVTDELFRVLKKSGLLFLNIGDTYYSGKGMSRGKDKKSSKRRFGLRAVDESGGMGIGMKPKSLIGIPWRVTTEMLRRNWILRSQIIWYRKHSLPEAVRDRPRRSYEYVFMFSKNTKYYFNRTPLLEVEQEDMWTITARPKNATGLGTAPYPDELVKRCLDIGCIPEGTVLDPFSGSGTTLRVALRTNRNAIGIDINPEFCDFIISDLNKMKVEHVFE